MLLLMLFYPPFPLRPSPPSQIERSLLITPKRNYIAGENEERIEVLTFFSSVHSFPYPQLRETVRKWAEEELAPIAADIDKNNEFPAV